MTDKQQSQPDLQVTNNPENKHPFHLRSQVAIAKTGSKSLRATVPEGIVAFLELSCEDKLEWRMEIIGNQRVAVVRRI